MSYVSRYTLAAVGRGNRALPLRAEGNGWQGEAGPRRERPEPMAGDQGLVARVAHGDQAAFATLYDRYAPLVYGIAKRVLGDATQAEDITQSVFTRIWAKPESFAGGNFTAWIGRVARNAALDVLRSSYTRTREPEMPVELPAETELEEEVFQRLTSGAVVAALESLPPDQRQAIERAFFQGFSYREVAEQLGAPLGTVKSRIRTALQRLSETLSEVRT